MADNSFSEPIVAEPAPVVSEPAGTALRPCSTAKQGSADQQTTPHENAHARAWTRATWLTYGGREEPEDVRGRAAGPAGDEGEYTGGREANAVLRTEVHLQQQQQQETEEREEEREGGIHPLHERSISMTYEKKNRRTLYT